MEAKTVDIERRRREATVESEPVWRSGARVNVCEVDDCDGNGDDGENEESEEECGPEPSADTRTRT